MCEKKCEYNDVTSAIGQVACKLPAIPTTYSNQQFNIGVESNSLNSGVYFGTPSTSDLAKAFDESVFTRVDTSDRNCVLGMQFKEGYVGSISQAKYFINYITNRDQYENNLAFEGSQDGETYTEIFKVDAAVHEGWNYVDFEEGSYPQYRFYRMRGLGGTNGPCRLHEITLTGTEVILSDTEEFECTPQLVLDGVADPIALSPVMFKGTNTPTLESISPRFGTRLGGETITFTGTGFSNSKTSVTVTLDGIDCAVTSSTLTEI